MIITGTLIAIYIMTLQMRIKQEPPTYPMDKLNINNDHRFENKTSTFLAYLNYNIANNSVKE